MLRRKKGYMVLRKYGFHHIREDIIGVIYNQLFNSRLKKAVEKTKVTKASFHKNTEKKRKKYLK